MQFEIFFKNGASAIIKEISEAELTPLYQEHNSIIVDAYKHEDVAAAGNMEMFKLARLSTDEMRLLIQLQNKLYEQ